MTIIDLLNTEAAGERRRLLTAAVLAGACNMLLLALVNVAAQSPDAADPRLFMMFVLFIGLYAFGARYTSHRTTHLIETALHRLRTRIVAKIERTEFERMERIGTAEIMDRLTQNTSVISDAAVAIAHLLQSLCVLVFGTLYLAWHSLPAFTLVAILLLAGMSLFMAKRREVNHFLEQNAQVRLSFFDLITDLLLGFKEVKFSQQRGRDIHADIAQSSESLRLSTTHANRLLEDSWIFANGLLFVTLGAVVFIIPRQMPVDQETLGVLVSGLMFVWSPLGNVVMGYPIYLRSNQALQHIQSLEEKLNEDSSEGPSARGGPDPWRGHVSTIEARNLVYAYKAEGTSTAFKVGPLNLTIQAGEILFIVGGNGSGKSTLLRLLTGLYRPAAGALHIDGILLQPDNEAAYREMISAIYSDFHLFAKLYGLLHVDETAVRRLLVQMQLEDKTSFADQRFTRRSLSTGQRKRLAMIVSLLEDRPICVFDEWAADQDPEFRKYFYEELLPTLKQQGKTVIVVSHDDRYFHCADRVVTMEYGVIRAIEQPRAPTRARPPSQ